jgi:predicted NAD/FAD-binding protein
MNIFNILYFVCVSLAIAGDTTDLFDPDHYASEDVLVRDVAVIGGGSTGTYAAVNLQNLGKSIILVEKENVLGGHTNTYIDQGTGIAVDYGLQAFWNSESTLIRVSDVAFY